MKPLAFASLTFLGLALAACGGSESGDTNIASAPPPLPAAAPAPAPALSSAQSTPQLTSISVEKVAPLSARAGLTSGSFDTKAVLTSVKGPGQILPANTVKLGIDAANSTYTLTIGIAGFPQTQIFNFSTIQPDNDPSHGMPGSDAGLGYHIVRTEHYSDNSTRAVQEDKTSALCCAPYTVPLSGGQFEGKSFSLNIAPHYVSFGQWDEYVGQPVPGTGGGYNTVSSKRVIFVQGLRTEPSDIPVAGTASYRLDGSDGYMPFVFVADFGARTMAASLDLTGGSSEDGFIPGVSARGVAPITNAGDFLIALNGSLIDAGGNPFNPLSGQLDGALFGPQGAQIGGVYQFNGQSGTFVGTKQP